jgi:E3 ubiquitin-protein ligase RNF115/126
MTGLFAMLGEPIGGGRAGPGPAHAFGGMPPTLTNFFAAINGGQHGDAVYSQEALDRIVSQLMEQTASGNAPGPAPEQAINALPRKPVSEEMLGAEHRAECSICMDEVNIGEEVTELPCKHWFHHPCISAWLSEHDTCPHCRKSIRKEGDESSGNGPSSTSANATTSGADPTTAMPGAFGAAGEGTINNPFILSSRAANSNANSSTNAQGGASEQSNSGLGGRIRRGLFGP